MAKEYPLLPFLLETENKTLFFFNTFSSYYVFSFKIFVLFSFKLRPVFAQ